MSGFTPPTVPRIAPSSKPPGITDPLVQDAGAQASRDSATAQGYASTILTSGTGVAQPPPVAKKTLLGG